MSIELNAVAGVDALDAAATAGNLLNSTGMLEIDGECFVGGALVHYSYQTDHVFGILSALTATGSLTITGEMWTGGSYPVDAKGDVGIMLEDLTHPKTAMTDMLNMVAGGVNLVMPTRIDGGIEEVILNILKEERDD